MTSDHTIETLRNRLKLKEAQLVKKIDAATIANSADLTV